MRVTEPEKAIGKLVYKPFEPKKLYRVIRYDGKYDGKYVIIVKDVYGETHTEVSHQFKFIDDLIEDHRKKMNNHIERVKEFERKEQETGL